MKRPSFQFYPGDWQTNSNLKRCTRLEKSVWLDVLCLMHDQEEYGVLRWTLKEIAEAAHCKVSELKSLHEKGVLKGADKGHTCGAYIYVPRSGRRDGDPVELLSEQQGPIWYSSRFVRDEYVRTIRGESSRFSEAPDDAPKPPKGERTKAAPKPPFGDGASSSSSSSSSASPENLKTIVETVVSGTPLDDFTPKDAAEWLRHFRTKHGFDADPTNVNDRKKLWPVFAAWTNAGLSASFVDAAVAAAQARSREPISCLPLYVDRLMAGEQASRASPTLNTRDESRRSAAYALTNVTVSAPLETEEREVVDVYAKRIG